MSMETLENRFYTRQEIAEIYGVDPKDHNFKRKMCKKLENYDYIYLSKGVIIEQKKETEWDVRLRQILKEKYGVSPSNLDAFCLVLYYLQVGGEEYESMAWDKRVERLKLDYDIDISVTTLKRWFIPLLNNQTIIRDKQDKGVWHISSKMTTDGREVCRRFIPSDDPEYQSALKYFNYFNELMYNEHKSFKETMNILWEEGGYGIYKKQSKIKLNVFDEELWRLCYERGEELYIKRLEKEVKARQEKLSKIKENEKGSFKF